MKRKLFLFAALTAVAAFVVSCSKDDEGIIFKASAEQPSDNGKMSFSGRKLLWSADDTISIYDNASPSGLYVPASDPNSSTCDFKHCSGGVASAAPFKAVCPASIHTSADEVTLPAVQRSPDGSLTRLPMYAYGTNENLDFYNLCGVVRFRLSASEAVSVSSIIVTADRNINGVAAISGSGTSVSLGTIGSGSATTTLSLGTAQSIASAKDFYMYLPADSYSAFSITLKSTANTTCTTATSSVTVERGKITTITLTGLTFGSPLPEGVLPGEFSVSTSRAVRFSKGNLQYQASTGTWRFATNQWNYIGSANSNISSSYSGWIDLFGWGTSGWNSGANCYQPWSTSTSYSDYYPGGSDTNNLTGAYANADWGVYNAISNGGDAVGLWRTLTHDEWNYVFYTRSASTVNGTENARYAKATVNSVKGMILFPDSYTHPGGVAQPTNINFNANFTGNSYSVSDWTAMETAGAVFLPTSGSREGKDVGNVGSFGGYWSSTCINSGYAWYVYFSDDFFDTYNGCYCYLGVAVRLVQD